MSTIAAMADYSNPASLGSRFRAKRKDKIAWLITRAYARHGQVRIIDLGGRPLYWNMFGEDFLRSKKVHITLVNVEDLPEAPNNLFTSMQGNACNLDFPDNAFELVHTNSTIEHVGIWHNMEAFACEVRRLAPNYYVQTPYYWCPIDPHAIFPFHHWLPANVRTKLMMRVKLGKYPKATDIGHATRIVHSTMMLDRAQMKFLFPDAKLKFEWAGPIPKSLIAMKVADSANNPDV